MGLGPDSFKMLPLSLGTGRRGKSGKCGGNHRSLRQKTLILSVRGAFIIWGTADWDHQLQQVRIQAVQLHSNLT